MNSPDSEITAGTEAVPLAETAVWGPCLTAGLGVLITIGFIVAQLMVVSTFVAVTHASDSVLNPLEFADDLVNSGLVLAICTLASTVVGVPLILLVVKLRRGATVAGYLSLVPISGKTVWCLLALTAGFIIISDGLTLLLGKCIVPSFMAKAYQTSVWPPLLWLALVIAAPAFEETFFRGFLLEGFRRSRMGSSGAIGLTALPWTLMHVQYGVYELATIFVLGVLLAVVRLKTGSLWSCYLMHGLINLVATTEAALHVRGLEG